MTATRYPAQRRLLVASFLLLATVGLRADLPGGVTVEEAAAAANKWSYDLIDDAGLDVWIAVKRATLVDPALHMAYASLSDDDPGFEVFARRVSAFAWEELTHLQHSPVFAREPGNMPWGRVGLFQPVYRRIMPTEIYAMARHTDKPSAACESLAFFLSGLFRLHGVAGDDIVHLRLSDHTVTVICHDGVFYGTNNTAVGRFTEPILSWHLDQRYHGVVGERFAGLGRFRLDPEDLYGSGSTLLEAIEDKVDIEIGPDPLVGVDPTDRDALKRRMFGTDGVVDPRMALLVRYAYQTTDVPSFEPYFAAAEKGPLVRALARSLRTEDAITRWIESNIADGVVLDDDRIQMPDQVLVYREGTTLDRALLARTLSVLAGIAPVSSSRL